MKGFIMCVAILATYLLTNDDVLTGRWESRPSKTGTVTGVVFKADRTMEGYMNRKPFMTGSYEIKDSLIIVEDNGCAAVKGTYKLILFSNADSMRFELVSDACVPRSKGMPNLVMGRVKQQ